MNQPPIRQTVARILSSTASDLARIGDLRRARGLAAAAQRAGAEDGVAQLVQFRTLLAAGRPDAALRAACGHLEAGANPKRMIAAFVAGRTVANRSVDAALRETVIAAVTDPARRDALLPILEGMTRGAKGTVAPAALYLACAISAGRAPKFDLVSPLLWAAALQWLIRDRPPELLRPVSKQLSTRFPEAAFLKELDDFLTIVPPPLPGAPFRDRLDADLQIVPAAQPNATTLLLCFCGKIGHIGMPVQYFHRWTQRLPAHVLYLRDPAEDFFASGVPQLGLDWAGVLQFVRDLADVLGVERVAIYGNSMGGLPAIRAGAELGATRVVSMCGRTEHDEVLNQATPETLQAERRRWRRLIGESLRAATAPPEIACIYGADNRADADDAKALAGLPGVRLVPVPEFRRHNAGIKLAADGRLERVLAWVVGMTDELSVE